MARVAVSNRPGVMKRFAYVGGTSRVEAASDVGLLITSDLELQVLFQRSDTAHFGTLISRLGFTGTTYGFYFAVDSAAQNRINYRWSPTGLSANLVSKVQSLATRPIPTGAPIWLRVTHDVDNGAAGNDVRFYTGAYNGTVQPPSTWSQLGATQTTAGTTTIFNPTGTGVTAGSFGGGAFGQLAGGYIYRAIVKNGIDGPIIVDLDATELYYDYSDLDSFGLPTLKEPGGDREVTISGAGVSWATARPTASGRVSAP